MAEACSERGQDSGIRRVPPPQLTKDEDRLVCQPSRSSHAHKEARHYTIESGNSSGDVGTQLSSKSLLRRAGREGAGRLLGDWMSNCCSAPLPLPHPRSCSLPITSSMRVLGTLADPPSFLPFLRLARSLIISPSPLASRSSLATLPSPSLPFARSALARPAFARARQNLANASVRLVHPPP